MVSTDIDKEYMDYDYSYGVGFIEIVKHSPNIIDLIEEGDYVNGEKVIDIWNGNRIETHRSNFNDDNIKSIVTKEAFAQAEYKIEKGE